jgi:CBS domain-containing protein/ribosomal protein S27AE
MLLEDMKIGIKVGDVMTRNFVSVKPDLSIAQCAKVMVKKRVGSVIVKHGDNLKGILTEGDIVRTVAGKKNPAKIKVKDIMSKSPVTIGPSEDMYDALVKMRAKKIRWLPVTVKNSVIGLLTIKDILRIEPSLFDIVSEMNPIKEEIEKFKAIKMRKIRASLARGEVWIKEGECQECGAYGILFNVDERLICEECKEAE